MGKGMYIQWEPRMLSLHRPACGGASNRNRRRGVTQARRAAGAAEAGLVTAGQLNRREFEDGIRRQMGLFVQRRLSGLMEDGAGRETETHVFRKIQICNIYIDPRVCLCCVCVYVCVCVCIRRIGIYVRISVHFCMYILRASERASK